MEWHGCTGCETFNCLNHIGHITEIGTKFQILAWWGNHFHKRCQECHCLNKVYSFTETGKQTYRLRCTGAACRKSGSFYQGLPFEDMRTDPRDMFLILLFFCRGLNQQTACMFTGVSPKTHHNIIEYVSRVISAYNFKDFVDSLFDEAQADETAIGEVRKRRKAQGERSYLDRRPRSG